MNDATKDGKGDLLEGQAVISPRSYDRRVWNRAGAALVLIVLLALLLLGCSGAAQKPPSVGSTAPSFKLPSALGGEVSLADLLGKKPVLLYFNMADG